MPNLRTLLFGRGNRIGRRLIIYIIAFSSAITLCISIVQLFLEYRDLRNTLDRQFDGVKIYVPSIAGSVWDFDQQQVQRALDALILLPNIVQVSLSGSNNGPRWSAGGSQSDNLVARTYSVRHNVRGMDTEIATLTVIASLDGIYRQVIASAVSIVVSNGLKTFLVALFMVYLIRRLITLRLEKMARKVHRLIPESLPLKAAVELRPRRIPDSFDELDAVDWTLDKATEDLHIAVEALTTLADQLEQRVADRTAKLEAANKELEAFSYSVSHDLRTPLRAIDGFSHALLDEYADKLDAEGRRMLKVVRDNTIRMERLIDDILNFSRTGRVELVPSEIDMEALARDVFEELRSGAGDPKPQLEIEAIPNAAGDGAMMRQVFVNLISNAIKFSRNREAPRIKVGAAVKGKETIYFVNDNGVGFDMQYAGKLFGVFQRLHGIHEFEGTGIGLAIVKRIITRHGGRVWAEGKPNEGATVYFALPALAGAHHGSAQAPDGDMARELTLGAPHP